MSDSILSGEARILPCPGCGEMIYSNAAQCRFCGATIDRRAAEEAADLQKKVNDACNQAKWIRHMATAMCLFVLLGLVLTLFQVGGLGLFVAIPTSALYWWFRFGSLKTSDPDYKKARRDWFIALLLWLPAASFQFLVIVFI